MANIPRVTVPEPRCPYEGTEAKSWLYGFDRGKTRPAADWEIQEKSLYWQSGYKSGRQYMLALGEFGGVA